MEEEELSFIQVAERSAMTGDKQAILIVVSALRRYRAEVRKLLGNRYSDGECDSATIHKFEMMIESIEAGEDTP